MGLVNHVPCTNTLYKEKNATTLSTLPYTFMRQEKRHEEARSPDNIYMADDKGSSEEEAAPALHHHHTYHSLTIIDSILFIYWSFGCLPPLHPSSHLSFSYYYWFDCYIFSLHLLILWLSTSSLICCPFKGFNWRRL